ncbi:MAG TPA: hypothetical protein VKA49_19090 [Flavitalea sp.]|nr:hypothetical protein [Flavitalea sp.]
MKYYMFSKTMKVLPRLKWLTVFVPASVKGWLTASDKSFMSVVDELQYSDKSIHPAESHMIRVTQSTPRP